MKSVNYTQRIENDDRGVSPIIAVILMIVASVVLASIVFSFSIGVTDLLQKPPQAGITVDQTYNENGADDPTYDIQVVASSMPNADYITVEGPVTSTRLDDVGSHTTLTGLEKGDTVIITATAQGETVVIRRYTVN